MWTEYGGSGLGLAFEEVNDLDWADIVWLYNRQNEQRKREADSIRKASKSKRTPPTT